MDIIRFKSHTGKSFPIKWSFGIESQIDKQTDILLLIYMYIRSVAKYNQTISFFTSDKELLISFCCQCKPLYLHILYTQIQLTPTHTHIYTHNPTHIQTHKHTHTYSHTQTHDLWKINTKFLKAKLFYN